MWRAAVATNPGALFLRFEDARGEVTEWSYGEFDRVVEGAANRLAEAGVGPGDSVHLALTNSPTFVAVWLAAVRLGAWIVPSDPMATTPELGEHLGRTSPVVGFCAADAGRDLSQRRRPPPDGHRGRRVRRRPRLAHARATLGRAPVRRWATGRR